MIHEGFKKNIYVAYRSLFHPIKPNFHFSLRSVKYSSDNIFAVTQTTSNTPSLNPFQAKMEDTTKALGEKLLQQDRVALSRAITLIESFKLEHSIQAQHLLEYVITQRRQKESTNQLNSFRIGIAGPPGAGKSTFIEALGVYILNKLKSEEETSKFSKKFIPTDGHKIAVLTIDPSSSRTGGSILGDKTRMDILSQHSKAFVRPSPTSGKLGGVAEHTNDVILLCECAGYDIIIVETVGLGQSEILIDDVVDMVIMLTPPQMGDELQGVKKGIMEIADAVVVNKADGPLADIARHAATDYVHTFQLLRRKHKDWQPRVSRVSAKEQVGMDKVWEICSEFRYILSGDNEIGSNSNKNVLKKRREEQGGKMVWSCVMDEIKRRLKYSKQVEKVVESLRDDLSNGLCTPRKAAANVVDVFVRK